ncbi:MAG: transglutaminase family protein [Gloeomargarita sp. HHBFW_bins_162]
MRYRIRHDLTYTYAQPVQLSPQIVRLHPRCDAMQTVQEYHLTLDPAPLRCYQNLAIDGSTETQVIFSQPISSWQIHMETVVITHRDNPFDFLLEPWAVSLPMNYPHTLFQELHPYWEPVSDPVAVGLAQELWQETEGQTLAFLSQLNQKIYYECTHLIRPTGAAWPAGITWQKKQGACRDLTVLFMTVVRAMGLATRFVSGYHEGDPDWQHRHLHAWAEVYLPGGGWRGFDPTHGLVVNDRYVALTARPYPPDTAPVTGLILTPGVSSHLDYKIHIQGL